MVFRGFVKVFKVVVEKGFFGKFLGISNVYLVMRFNIFFVGIVVYEWFMGIVVIVGNYKMVIEMVFWYWVVCFGLKFVIVLIDIFGIREFFSVFS